MLTKNIKIFNKEFIERFDLHLHKVFAEELKSNKPSYLVKRLDNFLHKTFDLPKQDEHDYSKDYFTFVSLSDNNEIRFCNSIEESDTQLTIQVSTDDGNTWIDFESSYYDYGERTGGTLIGTLNKGDKLLVRGENAQYADDDETYDGCFSVSNECNVEGNIMSLIYGNEFVGKTEFSDDSSKNFAHLFDSAGPIINASNLILPATTLTSYCYIGMFQNCTSLATAPELPATTLSESCYNTMFVGCTSLIAAPELPATTLSDGCYSSMFSNCISLTAAPKLPATTLSESCYITMFFECTSLTTASELSATTLADSCYNGMFQGCTSLVTAPELPATTLAVSCYEGMFEGCTSLIEAPELPATTLVDDCYGFMFHDCTSLNYIKCLAEDINAESCTDNWVNGVSSVGTFVKSPNMDSWGTGLDGIPENWDVEDAEI